MFFRIKKRIHTQPFPRTEKNIFCGNRCRLEIVLSFSPMVNYSDTQTKKTQRFQASFFEWRFT